MRKTKVSKQIANIIEYVDERSLELTVKQRKRAIILANYLDRAERIAIELEIEISL